MVKPISFLEPVRAAIRNHHERWDGTGYPDKLMGKAIPLIARIVNCADTFDACTSTRPYQKAMPLDKAITGALFAAAAAMAVSDQQTL